MKTIKEIAISLLIIGPFSVFAADDVCENEDIQMVMDGLWTVTGSPNDLDDLKILEENYITITDSTAITRQEALDTNEAMGLKDLLERGTLGDCEDGRQEVSFQLYFLNESANELYFSTANGYIVGVEYGNVPKDLDEKISPERNPNKISAITLEDMQYKVFNIKDGNVMVELAVID